LGIIAVVCVFIPTLSEATVANTISFQGRLFIGESDPSANTQFDLRFSLWATPDFTDGVDRVSGNLVGASWTETQTITTDTQGFFITNIGSVTPLPEIFDATLHQYLQTELKVKDALDTSYFVLDNMSSNNTVDRKSIVGSVYAQNSARLDGRKAGLTPGDIPYLDPVTGKLDRSLITIDNWLDPVADETAMNNISSPQNGDIVFVQSEKKLYAYDGTQWINAGGNSADVTAIETQLDSAETTITSNTAAITTEKNRAESAELTLTTNLGNEITRATDAESALGDRVTTAETNISTNTAAISTETTRATNAEGTLTTNLGNEAARATNAESALNGRLTTAEGNITTNANTITNNGTILTTLNGDINTAGSVLKSIKDTAKNALFSSITGLVSTSLGSAIDEVNTNLSNAIQGLTWKSPVAEIADLFTTYPTPSNGDSVYVTGAGEIYTYNGSEWVKISSTSSQDAAIETLETDLNAAEEDILINTTAISGETTRATDAESAINDRVTTAETNISTNTTNIASNTAAISTETTRATNAEGTLTTNLGNEATRATEAEDALDTRITTNAINIGTNNDTLTTLNADVSTNGSILKSIKDTAKNASFTSTTGLSSTSLGTAIDEVSTSLNTTIQGLHWKSPVTNVGDLTTTYTSPVSGDIAYVTSTNDIYAYNGSSWVEFLEDGTTSTKGIIQFATDGEIAALKAVQSNDARLAQIGINTTNIDTNAANIAILFGLINSYHP
jgi:hypothetical protein